MSIANEIVESMRGRRIVALTGAGISTDSGIPDYRGPGTRARARSPLQYKEFIAAESARKRYWARSCIGWPRINASAPNAGHRALAVLEEAGLLDGIITQNVDRLHQRAGSKNVIELHGALEEVRCLGCDDISSRATLQDSLLALNPGWETHSGPTAPDGDSDVEDPRMASFRIPACNVCSGILKPHVVFFGESVPRAVVDRAWELYDRADLLLVVGTSLAVYSGFRFVRRAAQEGKPVILLNIGETRGDDLALHRWSESLSVALPWIAESLATMAPT